MQVSKEDKGRIAEQLKEELSRAAALGFAERLSVVFDGDDRPQILVNLGGEEARTWDTMTLGLPIESPEDQQILFDAIQHGVSMHPDLPEMIQDAYTLIWDSINNKRLLDEAERASKPTA